MIHLNTPQNFCISKCNFLLDSKLSHLHCPNGMQANTAVQKQEKLSHWA